MIKAALLIKEYGVPWLPLMMELLQASDDLNLVGVVEAAATGSEEPLVPASEDPSPDRVGILVRLDAPGSRRDG